jgi:hypothetical protein
MGTTTRYLGFNTGSKVNSTLVDHKFACTTDIRSDLNFRKYGLKGGRLDEIAHTSAKIGTELIRMGHCENFSLWILPYVPRRKQLRAEQRLATTRRQEHHETLKVAITYSLQLLRDYFYVFAHPEVVDKLRRNQLHKRKKVGSTLVQYQIDQLIS